MHRVRALADRLQRRLAPLALLGFALAAGACDSEPKPPVASLRSVAIAPGPHPVAILQLKDLGTIRIELLPEAAPKTVAQFEKLAGEGFYDGTTFHRVIPGFMVQGGCPNTRNADPRDDGKGGTEYVVEDEFTDLTHSRGTVAMANRGTPNTAGTQFFIVLKDSSELDGRYSVFGRVTEGMDVVDKIAQLEIDKFGRYGPPDRPYPVPARIDSVRIETPPGATAQAGGS